MTNIIPDKFHAICRKATKDIPWLRPSQVSFKLSENEKKYRDRLRMDIVYFSDASLECLIYNVKEPMWIRRIAMAEKLLRKL